MLRGSTVTQMIAFWLRTEKVVGICSFLGLPPNKVVPRLKQKVMSFKQGMPVITSLRNAALRTRHWEAIQNVIGTRIVRDKYFTLGHLLQLKVINNCKPRGSFGSRHVMWGTFVLCITRFSKPSFRKISRNQCREVRAPSSD